MITVHGWDVRQGLGAPHAIAGDAADLLVPFVFLLWWATAEPVSVDSPYAIGIRTTGQNGGDTRFDVSDQGLRFAPGDIDEHDRIQPGSIQFGRLDGHRAAHRLADDAEPLGAALLGAPNLLDLVSAGGVIVDIGGGTGNYALALAELGWVPLGWSEAETKS